MPQHQANLLLVDGDAQRAQRLASRLSRPDLEIRISGDGATGLLKAHERRPDVVVVAAETPILDGYRMLDALRSQPQTCDVLVILITEGNSPSELARGWNAGADLCIPRVHGEADVLATLHRALSGLRSWDQAPREVMLAS